MRLIVFHASQIDFLWTSFPALFLATSIPDYGIIACPFCILLHEFPFMLLEFTRVFVNIRTYFCLRILLLFFLGLSIHTTACHSLLGQSLRIALSTLRTDIVSILLAIFFKAIAHSRAIFPPLCSILFFLCVARFNNALRGAV